MRTHAKVPVALLCGAVLLLGAAAPAQEKTDADKPKEKTPFEIVRVNSEEVLAILRDNEKKGRKATKERRDAFTRKIADYFDWPAIAQHGLGLHWRNINDEQRDAFTKLFRRLLEQVYYSRLQRHAVDAKIEYLSDAIDGDRAVVTTVAVKDARRTPINYHMRKKGEKDAPGPLWLIYDVKVEGVSLLLNYREQFNEIIVSGSFGELMERLEAKVESNRKKLNK